MERKEIENIILIGMMGSGKTSVGQMLACKLAYTFVDTDAEVEREVGRKISEIFATEGEEFFREREREVVKQVAEKRKQVIGTGGGAILNSANRQVLKDNGLVIYLNTSPEVLYQRLKNCENRPLLQSPDLPNRIKELHFTRLNIYRSVADIEIDTSELSADQVVEKIVDQIKG